MAEKLTPAKNDEVVVHVPKGTADKVSVVEIDPEKMGQDITIQVSRERKPHVSPAIGVIVK